LTRSHQLWISRQRIRIVRWRFDALINIGIEQIAFALPKTVSSIVSAVSSARNSVGESRSSSHVKKVGQEREYEIFSPASA